MNKTRILVADDHQMVRKGIISLLNDNPELEVVAEAADGLEVLSILKKEPIDMVIMDIKMPRMNGIDVTYEVRANYPEIKVLAISMYDEYQYVQSILQAGAMGYILKDTEKDELILAIKKLLDNKNYYSDKVLSKITSKVLLPNAVNEPKEDYLPTLTKREMEVMRLIAKEYSNQEIADRLNVSSRTVDTHKRNLIKKLKVKNIVGLVKFAMKHNLTEV